MAVLTPVDGAPAGPIIEATGVHKVYLAGRLEVPALRGVDLTIARGEMVAIMGPSGCGKITPLNTLSGLNDLTAEQVLTEGQPLHEMSDKQSTR